MSSTALQISGLAHNLANRLQTVTVNVVTFVPVDVSRGVPHGSVLGPIFFLLYIKDFHHCSIFFIFIYLRMALIYSPSGLTRM